jgi:ribosomal protein S27E
MVWLSGKYIQMKQPGEKLNYKFYGFYLDVKCMECWAYKMEFLQ